MKIKGRLLLDEDNSYLIKNLQLIPISGKLDGSNYDIVELKGKFKEKIFKIDSSKILKKGQPVSGNENWNRAIYDFDLRKSLYKSQKLLQEIRDFFLKENFLEVYTPLLNKYAAMEPNIDSFETNDHKKEKLYLHTSPEYNLKQVLVSGIADKIFQISPVFRKEKIGKLHNPEFLMLEWYRSFEKYEKLMDDLLYLIKYLTGKEFIQYKKSKIKLDSLDKITVKEAFKKYTDTSLREIGVFENEKNWKEKFFQLLVEKIEPNLGWERPTILYEYPVELAALSKVKDKDKRFSKRFELYIGGIELANCFEELNDADEQLKRFEKQKKKREKLKKPVHEIDEKFIKALRVGMPPASGGALGINRLIMILLNKNSIKKTLLFPYS